MSSRNVDGRRPQFTIRAAFFATVLIALAFGWYVSLRNANRRNAELSSRLAYAEAELSMGKSRAKFQERLASTIGTVPIGVLSGVQLEWVNLRGATISGVAAAFHLTSFYECDLQDASLSGALSAFQGSRFDNASLVNAKLTGGAASFQLSSFVNADVSGGVLTGGGASFQGASFQGARCVGTQFVCGGGSFQVVNIDGAQFQGADLSALEDSALKSCYFQTPPRYDETTRFPKGFNPMDQLWTLVK